MGVAGIPDAMIPYVKSVLSGTFDPLNPNVRVRRTKLHNRLAWASGSTVTQFKFFDADPANLYVGNLKSTGLPNDQVAILWSMGLKAETSYDIAGSAVAGGTQVDVLDRSALIESIRRFYENGLVTAKVGDWAFIQDVHGVYNFPQGNGPDLSSYGTLTAAAMGGVINNGSPFVTNRWEFAAPVILPPNKLLRVIVDLQTAIAPSVNSVLKCEFDATIVSPVNA